MKSLRFLPVVRATKRPNTYECYRSNLDTHLLPAFGSGRHTLARMLSAEGKDLQYIRRQLGHESIKLTADTYGGWLDSVDERGNDCLDDPTLVSVTTEG